MKLVFVHGTKIKEDSNGTYYTGGSFSQSLWNRYLSISSELSVIARKDSIVYDSEYARQSFNYFNKEKMYLIEVPNLVSSIKTLFSFKKHKMKNERIKKAVLYNDCVIARLPSSNGNTAINMARKYHKPYLIELVGCPWDAYWNHSWKGKLFAPFMWYVTKKMVKNAPYVLYVTNDFLQRRYPSTGRTINCSDVALPTLDESVLDARLQKIKQMTKNKPVVIGTTAAVDVRYKGQEYVIQAIAELNKQGYNFEYRLVGGGDKTYLQSIAEKYSVADKVIFEGSIPHERVFDYLDSIDIYVQPSKTEGLPRALIEAMSRGCPCIGSNAGGIPELLDNMFIFSSGNVKELATILASFDIEKMIYQAKRNFEMSKGFAKDVIETRRNEFLLSFKKYADKHMRKII
jgi:glycosyltransferase involved in cell wall biosynthesis